MSQNLIIIILMNEYVYLHEEIIGMCEVFAIQKTSNIQDSTCF